MRKSLVFMVFLTILFSTPLYAGKQISVAEKKKIENAEYVKCMAITKKNGAEATIRYIREKQKGTSLKSTPTSLAEENCAADSIGLVRYQTLDEIGDACEINNLVSIGSSLVEIKNKLPEERRVGKPYVRDYLIELAQYMKSQTKATNIEKPRITVTSLVRSRIDQNRICESKKTWQRVRGKFRHFFTKGKSFADCSTDAVCSTHLTGAAVDIEIPANKLERKLLTERLLHDRDNGRIFVIVENFGNHFHAFILPPRYQVIGMEKMPKNIVSLARTSTQ